MVLGHDGAAITLDKMLKVLENIRFWQHCSGDVSVFYDPMAIDYHQNRGTSSEECQRCEEEEYLEGGEEAYYGERRHQRPVL